MNFFASNLNFDNDTVARKLRFRDSDEMNRSVIEGWNKVVVPTDTVYILGGVGEFEYLKSLNGDKVLIYSDKEGPFYRTYVTGVTSIRNKSIDRELFELYVSYNYGIKRVIFNKKTVIRLYSGREVNLTTHEDGLDVDRFNIIGCVNGIDDYYKLYSKNLIRCLNVDVRNNLLHPISEHSVDEVCSKFVGKGLHKV